MRGPKFEVFHGKDGDWYWRYKGGNGEIQASSEGYKTKRGALRSVNRMVHVIIVSTIPVVEVPA